MNANDQNQLDQLRDAAGTFCDRVERGEVRSKRTYAQFCKILGRTPRAVAP